uniref:Uncharacterized protein n=1 Tax=viral metagenome TaxID=1070528 RepID=A0A6M3XVV4_9ZZZZ
MLLTEEEAREKECRDGSGVDGLGYSQKPTKWFPRCSASDCVMGWRWWDNPTAGKAINVQDKGDFFLVSKDELQQFINNALRPSPDRLGYCGLGGKPEE